MKTGIVILHGRADEVIPFANSEELAANSGATVGVLIADVDQTRSIS